MTRHALAALLLAVAAPARGGVIIVAHEHDGDSTVYVEGKKVRFEEPAARARTMIFDGDSHRMLHLDAKAHTYVEMTEADGKALSSRLQEALARMPPEQRARMEAMMKGSGRDAPARKDHDVKYVALGSHQEVAGYGCDGYKVVQDGKPVEEGCFIPWSARAVTKGDLAGLAELGKFGEQFLANVRGPGAQPGGFTALHEKIEAAPGFPAVLESVRDGTRTSTYRLVSIQRTRVPSSRFEVPADYRKVENPAFGPGK